MSSARSHSLLNHLIHIFSFALVDLPISISFNPKQTNFVVLQIKLNRLHLAIKLINCRKTDRLTFNP